MSGRRRTSAQLARDRRKISNKYLQGWIQADIAVELGISQSTVSNDIKAIQKSWLASGLRDFDTAKSRELAKVDRLEREYWEAWYRSREDSEVATSRQSGKIVKYQDGEGKFATEQPAIIIKSRKKQVGDPRFLAGIQWCIERRCKMMGFDAPSRGMMLVAGVAGAAGTGEGGMLRVRLEQLPGDERVRIMTMIWRVEEQLIMPGPRYDQVIEGEVEVVD